MKRHLFTLVELLAAMVIIVILAGLLLAASSTVNKLSKKRAAQSMVSALEIVLEQYKSDWGFYPESKDDVLELGSWENWHYLHLRKPATDNEDVCYQKIYVDLFDGTFETKVDTTNPTVPAPCVPPVSDNYQSYFVKSGDPLYIVDPYGQPFYYENPGVMNPEKFDLWSKGRDGEHGEAGVDDDGDGTTDNANDASAYNALESDDIGNWGTNR